MKIDKLHLQDFGQFHDKDISLAPGVNILYGANEAGKTTTKDFIVDMMYGLDGSQNNGRVNAYEKRKPINSDAYAGSMEVTTEQGQYQIDRNFLKESKSAVVKDLNSGYEVPLQQPDSLLGTLIQTDKSTYMNTLCVGQTELATSHAIVDRLNDYIVNMASTRAGDVDAVNAITQLNDKKKEFVNEPLEAREQELTAQLQLDRDYDAEIAAVEEEYKKVEASGGDKKEAKLQFTPIKNSSMREEEEAEEAEQEEEPAEELTDREKDMKMLQNMGKRSILDNTFVLLFFSLVFIALFVGIAWVIPVNIPELKMGIMGFGIILVVITTIQVFSRRAKLYRLLEELEIEQGFEDAKAEVAMSQSADQSEWNAKLAELRNKKDSILQERKAQEEMLVEINQIKEKMAANNVELAALDLAIRTIQDLSEDIYDSFGSVLNEQVSALVRKITNGKYTEVRIDDQLNVLVKSGNSFISMDYLSTGTIEQIYLALRLSIANVLIAEDLPIIIDDIFVTYDYQRLYDTVSCLGEYLNRQIIMFTTNPGLQEMCTQLGIAYHAISL